jgi:hypothetical protein
MNSFFLLAGPAFGSVADFSGRVSRLACVRLPLVVAASRFRLGSVLRIDSCSCSFVSPDRVAGVTIHRSGREKQQVKSSTIRRGHIRHTSDRGKLAGWGPFLCTRQNPAFVIGKLEGIARQGGCHRVIAVDKPSEAIISGCVGRCCDAGRSAQRHGGPATNRRRADRSRNAPSLRSAGESWQNFTNGRQDWTTRISGIMPITLGGS